MLVALDRPVMHLQEKFLAKTPDEDWIPWVGGEGLILVSDDNNIIKKPHQKALLLTHSVRAVFLAGSYAKLALWQQAVNLLTWWPKIEKAMAKSKPGFCLRVSINGKTEPWKL
jgi:hypothetical protein